MSRNTLIGFLLIGLILLFWPTYLDIVFPEDTPRSPQEKSVSKGTPSSPKKIQPPIIKKNNEEVLFNIETDLYSAVVSNKNGGSISSFIIRDHLKEGEEKIQLIDQENSNNLLVSFVNSYGEEVFLEDFWGTDTSLPTKISLTQEKGLHKISFYTTVGGSLAQKSLTFKNLKKYLQKMI